VNDINFCPACGKELSAGTAYCPACGNNINGQPAYSGQAESEKRKNIERTKMAAVLLLITAFLSITSGLWLYYNSADFINGLIDTYPEFTDMLSSMTAIMEVSGLLCAVAGFISIAVAWLAFKRKVWDLTVVLCVIVAVLGNLLLGLIALWLIWKAKPVFEGNDQAQNVYR